jgi:hypothetical protein
VTKRHPVRDLCAKLEAARLGSVEALAAAEVPPPTALQDLATLQAALTAVVRKSKPMASDGAARTRWISVPHALGPCAPIPCRFEANFCGMFVKHTPLSKVS